MNTTNMSVGDASWLQVYEQTLKDYVAKDISPEIMKYKSDLNEFQKVFVKWWNNYMLITFTLNNIFRPCVRFQAEG